MKIKKITSCLIALTILCGSAAMARSPQEGFHQNGNQQYQSHDLKRPNMAPQQRNHNQRNNMHTPPKGPQHFSGPQTKGPRHLSMQGGHNRQTPRPPKHPQRPMHNTHSSSIHFSFSL